MRKLINTEAELKKSVTYKKKRVYSLFLGPLPPNLRRGDF